MGLVATLQGLTPLIGKGLRYAQPAVQHVGKNLWKYGGALEGGKALLSGKGPVGIASDIVSGASTAGLLQAGIPRGRHLLRGGLLKAGLRPDQALLASSVAVPALAAGGSMLLGGPSGPAGQTIQGTTNVAANTGQNVVGAGAHLLNQQGVGPYQDPLGGLPPGTINRMIGPDGGIWYQLAPGGPASAQRIGRVLGAQADASVINTLGNALYGQTERVAKAELERQAAAEQLKANIDMAKQMSLNSQQAGLNIAQNAGVAMGNAMSQRNMFRYF